jgi:hypothetical protein
LESTPFGEIIALAICFEYAYQQLHLLRRRRDSLGSHEGPISRGR